MNRSVNVLFLILFICVFLSLPAYSYVDSRYGQPFITCYTPDDYPGEGQCFDIAVTSDNLIYVANSAGVLEFDGVTWRVIQGTEEKIIFSIAVDEKDRIWVGGIEGAGTIIPDNQGVLTYFPLTSINQHPQYPTEKVWRIATAPEGIYFQTPKVLVRYQPDPDNPLEGTAKHWPSPDNGITMTRYVNGHLYVKRAYLPLEELINDSLIPVPPVREEDKITLVDCDTYDDETLLLTPYNQDILLSDKNGYRPLEGEIQEYTKGTLNIGAMRIDKERYVLSSMFYGLVVFNRKGEVLEVIGTDAGLPSNVLNRRVTVDKDGGIWAALDYGLARVELNSPYRVLNKQNGLSGSFIGLQYFNSHLLAGSPTGLFVIPFNSNTVKNKQIPTELNFGVWEFDKAQDFVVSGTLKGPYLIDSKLNLHDATRTSGSKSEHFIGNATSVAISPDNKNVYVFIELKGVFHYRFENGRLFFNDKVETPPYTIFSMAVKDSMLWITDETQDGNRVYRSVLSTQHPEILQFEPFEINAKVTSKLMQWDKQVFINTDQGLFYFNSKKDRFENVKNLYGDSLIFKDPITAAGKISEDIIFISAGPYNHQLYRIAPDNSNFIVTPVLSQFRIRNILSVTSSEETGMAFFGTDDGRIISLNFNDLKAPITQPSMLIRSVQDESRHTLTMGNNSKKPLSLRWPNNSLRFNYSLTSMQSPELNQYRYRLGDGSGEWSDWSHESYKDINNLQPGNFTFEVMGKSVAGISSEVTTFHFSILPPWYRTTIAWIAWVVFFGMGVYGFIRYRLNQYERQRKMLEALVEERTRQLHETQQKELQEINARKFAEIETQRLLTATKLATAVSHEFNNPLAIIQGRVEIMCQQRLEDDDLKHKDSIIKQIDRMKNLVNQLKNIDHLPEVDYIKGIKMIDLHNLTSDGNNDSEEKSSEE